MEYLDTFRGILTIMMLLCFLGIVWWAYSAHRKSLNDEAAHLPFDDDEIDRRTLDQTEKNK